MGGRGGSSGVSRGAGLSEVRVLQKSLSAARAAESKAYTAYVRARGAVRVTPEGKNKLLETRRKARDEAYNQYQKAVEKREALESKIKKATKKRKKSNAAPLF